MSTGRSYSNSEQLAHNVVNWLRSLRLLPMESHDYEDLGTVRTMDFKNINGHITETKERHCIFKWHCYCECTVAVALKQTVSMHTSNPGITTLPEDPYWWLVSSIEIERIRTVEGPEKSRCVKIIFSGRDCQLFLEDAVKAR